MSVEFNTESKTAFEHQDYRRNLKWSRLWLEVNEPDFPKEVKVLLTSLAEPNQFLTFMFRPPNDWPGCGFAHHVTLQQPESSFNSEVHKTYDQFKKMQDINYYNKIIHHD